MLTFCRLWRSFHHVPDPVLLECLHALSEFGGGDSQVLDQRMDGHSFVPVLQASRVDRRHESLEP